MHCTWQVTIVRSNGRPDFEYTEVRGRAPTPSEVLERRSADGEKVRGKVGSWHRADFDQARADFAFAWRIFLSKRTEADFQAWRDQRDWTARKYVRLG